MNPSECKRQMMKSISALAMLLFITIPDSPAADRGVYAAFDAGQSRVSGLCNIVPPTVSCNETGKVIRLAAGYQFNPTWGIEFALAHLANVGAQGTTTTTAPNGSTIPVPYGALVRIRGSLLAGTATIPLGENWSVLTKLGDLRLANLNVLAETTNPTGGPWQHKGLTRFSLYWGIGVLRDVSNSYSIRAQYEDFGTVGNAYTGQFGLKTVTLGLVYKFY